MKGTGRPLQVLAVLDPDGGELLGWLFRCSECRTYAIGTREDMLEQAVRHYPPPAPAPSRPGRSFLYALARGR